MYEDVPSSIMLDKTILNELENENVNPLLSNKNSKRAVFTALFFINTKIIGDECKMKE